MSTTLGAQKVDEIHDLNKITILHQVMQRSLAASSSWREREREREREATGEAHYPGVWFEEPDTFLP